MASKPNKPNRGAFFRNDRKEDGSNQPDHTGSINVAGVEYRLSAWVNESKDGRRYFSLSVTPRDDAVASHKDQGDSKTENRYQSTSKPLSRPTGPRQRATEASRDDFDDPIPF
jgi:hypothetical protein